MVIVIVSLETALDTWRVDARAFFRPPPPRPPLSYVLGEQYTDPTYTPGPSCSKSG